MGAIGAHGMGLRFHDSNMPASLFRLQQGRRTQPRAQQADAGMRPAHAIAFSPLAVGCVAARGVFLKIFFYSGTDVAASKP